MGLFQSQWSCYGTSPRRVHTHTHTLSRICFTHSAEMNESFQSVIQNSSFPKRVVLSNESHERHDWVSGFVCGDITAEEKSWLSMFTHTSGPRELTSDQWRSTWWGNVEPPAPADHCVTTALCPGHMFLGSEVSDWHQMDSSAHTRSLIPEQLWWTVGAESADQKHTHFSCTSMRESGSFSFSIFMKWWTDLFGCWGLNVSPRHLTRGVSFGTAHAFLVEVLRRPLDVTNTNTE